MVNEDKRNAKVSLALKYLCFESRYGMVRMGTLKSPVAVCIWLGLLIADTG